LAFGTAAPVESRTDPVIVAVDSCALNEPAQKTTVTHKAKNSAAMLRRK
jgi:hypothetical protein